ncbi:MAG: glycosyltransferase [Pseudomonadota bacterium]
MTANPQPGPRADAPRIAVTVCTRERPTMLQACLASIIGDAAGDRGSGAVLIVVVENDVEPSCAAAVRALDTDAVPVVYVHEPRLGIPQARNAAVAAALARDADWIVFVDDDETVLPGWTAALKAAVARGTADVYTGPVEIVLAASRPDWMPPPKAKRRRDGTALGTAATNNTAAAARLFRPDGLALSFDERLRFTGGSDDDLFRRAVAAGVRIEWAAAMAVCETWPAARLTLSFHLDRARRVGENNMRAMRRRRGLPAACLRYLPKAIGRAAHGGLEVVISVLMRPIHAVRGLRLQVSGRRRIAYAVGIIRGLAGKTSAPYRDVVGK